MKIFGDRFIGKELDKIVGDNITYEKMKEKGVYYIDIAYADSTKLSYIPEDRLERFNGNFWDEGLRRKYSVMSRPGRVLGKLYDISYQDSIDVSNKMMDLTKYHIKICRGEEIGVHYRKYNSTGRGNLESCMSYVPLSYFRIYDEIGYLVTIVDENDITQARALVVENVKYMKDGVINMSNIMCRIYYNNNVFLDMLTQYAIEQDLIRFDGGYDATKLIFANNDELSLNEATPWVEIEEAFAKLPRYPYVDNFEYICRNTSEDIYILCTRTPYSFYNWDTCEDLHSTEGGSNAEKGTCCDGCQYDCNLCGGNDDGLYDNDDLDDDDDSDWD